MTAQVATFLAAGTALIAMALYVLVVAPNLLRKILALNVLGSGIFMLLLAIARRNGPQVPDPVPQAMVLTGLVVTVSATGFALALARRLKARTGAAQLPEDERETGP